MKALILAAGSGTRLMPLTADTPKPLLPVVGRPLLEHTIEHLRDHGIVEIAINLHHAGEAIAERLGDGARLGVRLTYSRERQLLGTAGAARALTEFLDEPFVVVYGDVLTDARLEPLVETHRRHDASLTMLLFRAPDPTAAGLVETDDDGRVRRFVEKPRPCDVFSDLANAGVLVCEPSVLESIPDDGPYDFGRDLLPRLLADGSAVWSHAVGRDEYLIDIGTPDAYLRAQTEWAERTGRVSFDEPVTIGAPATPWGEQAAAPVRRYLDRLAEVVAEMPREPIADVTGVLMRAWRAERTIVLMGNGGSAATASHMVNDLRKLTITDGWPRLRALSLTDNVPLLTAWANDTSYEEALAEPLRGLIGDGDVALGISTSGNSPNVLNAIALAARLGASTVGFTGRDGGRLAELAHHVVRAPSDHIGRQEDCHQVLDHVIANTMRELAQCGGAAACEASSALGPADAYLRRLERTIRELPHAPILDTIDTLMRAWLDGKTIFLMGNGGSAATAAHMVNDLSKLTRTDGWPRLRAFSLADNVPLMTAWGNDASYDDVFAEPLADHVRPGDVVLGISTSGNSPNVVKAGRVALERGARLVGFTGRDGGRLGGLAGICVRVPSDHIGRQEDCHLFLDHAIANVMRELALAAVAPAELAAGAA